MIRRNCIVKPHINANTEVPDSITLFYISYSFFIFQFIDNVIEKCDFLTKKLFSN